MVTKTKNKNSKIIFTDCFNTLIGRKITPDNVIYNWAVEMNKEYNKFSSIDFFRLFHNCWSELKRNDFLEKEGSEFLMNITEIFSLMYSVLAKYSFVKEKAEKSFVANAFKKYFEEEHKSQYIKRRILNYLLRKRKKGFKIFIVSDFYCKANVLKKWLRKLNVNCDYLFDDIFTSYDLGKSKLTGSIYKEIIKIKNLDPKNIMMIGDNIKSDIFMARKYGIRTKYIFPPIKRDCKLIRKIKKLYILPKQYQQIFDEDLEESSYTNCVFPLFLFVKRLADTCLKKRIKNLFFLARDGKFLKKIFDYYCKYNSIQIKTHYLFVSRKSIISTSCKGYKESLKSLSSKKFISSKNFLKTLNFSDEEISKIFKETKINNNIFYIHFEKSKAYKSILNSNIFNEIYKKFRMEQRESYGNYLKSFNVDLVSEGFYIVDSGWLGNMQKNLKNYFDTPVNIEGFYIGTVNKNAMQEKNYGLLFNSKLKNLGYFNKLLAYRRLNWEMFLRTEDGSCKKYDAKSNTPILESSLEEVEGYYRVIEPLQDKIFKKFQKMTATYSNVYCELENLCAYYFFQMIKHTKNFDRKIYAIMRQTCFDGFAYYINYNSNIFKFFNIVFYYIKDKFFIIKNAKHFRKKKII